MAASSLEPYGPQRRGTSHRGDQPFREDDERWHVRITDDDVKLMTLEQLDDAYRLSIVDSETSLWKQGMREWQPLRVVAGLEPDEDDAVEVDVDDEEPEITRVGPTPYDVTPRIPAVPLQRSLPVPNPPPRRSSSPPPRSVPPPPRLVSMLPPAPVSRSPEPAFVPLVRVTSPSGDFPGASIPAPPVVAAPAPVRHVRPVAAAPRATEVLWSQPASSPPVALSVAPAPYPYVEPRSGGFGRLLLAVAFLAGTAVSLYRNDILLDWARAGHLENQFLGVEQRLLGGPAFGTLRAVATSQPLLEPATSPAPVEAVVPAAAVAPVGAPAPVAPTAAVAPAAAVAPPAAIAPVVATRVAPPAPEREVPVKTSRPSAPSVAPRVAQARPATSTAASTQRSQLAAKAMSSGPAAVRVRLEEEPEAAPEPVKTKPVSAPPAASPATAAATGGKAGLDDAIRNAMSHKTPKKKRSGASEYDPLNPDL